VLSSQESNEKFGSFVKSNYFCSTIDDWKKLKTRKQYGQHETAVQTLSSLVAYIMRVCGMQQ
jgi:hypothetical protein